MNKRIRINGNLYEAVETMNESRNEKFVSYMKKVLSEINDITGDAEKIDYKINSDLAPDFDNLDRATEDKYYSILSKFNDINSDLHAVRNDIRNLIK